jgi:uncharacterized protein YydD (DUF2326 family)
MIHQLTASDPRFNSLEFLPGLNVLVTDKTTTSSDTDTRNGAGKTSLAHLLHFLLGANVSEKSIFKAPEITGWKFSLDVDVNGVQTRITRSGADYSKIEVASLHESGGSGRVFKPTDWCDHLGTSWFGLDGAFRLPTSRSLLSYAIRLVESGAFASPFRNHYQQLPGDYQTSVSFLLGLDWRLPLLWQEVRDQEKQARSLKKALNAEGAQRTVGTVAQLRTEVAIAEERVRHTSESLNSFRLVESFDHIQARADQLAAEIASLRDVSASERRLLKELEATSEQETPPSASDLEAMYEAVGVQLEGLVQRSFEAVREFHNSVVRNRRIHLGKEIERVRARLSDFSTQIHALDAERADLLGILRSGGALEELTTLQQVLGREEARAEELRKRYQLALSIESSQSVAKEQRQRLQIQLQDDQRDREDQLLRLIRRFEDITARLYDERVGSLQIGASTNGPTFDVNIEAGRSRGISNMQVFAFDILVSQLLAERGIGCGFLVHDSHIFDGVDERQIAKAFEIGKESAEEWGYQYIVTINSDNLPQLDLSKINIEDHILKVRLTDATYEGRLFGVKF